MTQIWVLRCKWNMTQNLFLQWAWKYDAKFGFWHALENIEQNLVSKMHLKKRTKILVSERDALEGETVTIWYQPNITNSGLSHTIMNSNKIYPRITSLACLNFLYIYMCTHLFLSFVFLIVQNALDFVFEDWHVGYDKIRRRSVETMSNIPSNLDHSSPEKYFYVNLML